jgi:3-hydroxyisobutyrate dehydrogenase
VTNVAFIGLGAMGGPMAGHLARVGHHVAVYNRTTSRAEAWVANHGGQHAATPAEAASEAEAVFVCVGNDDDVRSVILGDKGALNAMAPNTVLVDHTTASAGLAIELHELALARTVGFIDAPVSGGQAGAVNGVLTVMCGGDADVFERASPIIGAYARSVQLLGGPGSGQITKMVNQICIAGLVQALAEGVHFASQAGLDVAAVIDVISKGAAQSWQMENRALTMAAGSFDFGFAAEWMRKDLGICLDHANSIGARLPITALVDQFYAQIIERGGRRWDTSSLIHLLTQP